MMKLKSLKNVNLNSIKSEKNLKKVSCKKKIYVAKKREVLSILIEKAYIVAVVGGGYMMPMSDTIYKSYTGGKKKIR